eukprot:symbB.v1.2.038261.t1/scaffold5898.1/size44610/2
MMMTAIAKKLVTMVKDLIPQDLANTAWSFATLGLPDSRLLDQILLEVISKVNDFTTQNLANTAWAYAKLGLWNERWHMPSIGRSGTLIVKAWPM